MAIKIAARKQGFDEISVNESETHGLDLPPSTQGLEGKGLDCHTWVFTDPK